MKSIALECLSKELSSLKSLSALVNDTFSDIVRNILGCTGNVIFCGIGKSGNISEKISGTLACIGIRAFYQDCTHLGHGNTGAVRADDIIFCISKSGNTSELVDSIAHLKRVMPNIRVISITCANDSKIKSLSDIYVAIDIMEEADMTGLIPTTSTTACLVYGDILACAIEKEIGYTQNTLANTHPFGEIGKITK